MKEALREDHAALRANGDPTDSALLPTSINSYTGAKNYEIRGSGKKIDADGIDNDGYALDAKYIDKPLVSPYIPGSDCKDPGRIPVLAQLDDELRRYTAIVHDPSTPIVGLKIITNHPDAA